MARCVRDCVKLIRGMKAIQRFADRAPFQKFLVNFDRIHGNQMMIDRVERQKEREFKERMEDRQRRIDAGEAVSDTSSQKEAKRIEKEKLMEKIRKSTTVNTSSSPYLRKRLMPRGFSTEPLVVATGPKMLNMFSPIASDKSIAPAKSPLQQKKKKIVIDVSKKLSFNEVKVPDSPTIPQNKRSNSIAAPKTCLINKKNQSDTRVTDSIANTKKESETMLKIKMIKMASSMQRNKT